MTFKKILISKRKRKGTKKATVQGVAVRRRRRVNKNKNKRAKKVVKSKKSTLPNKWIRL